VHAFVPPPAGVVSPQTSSRGGGTLVDRRIVTASQLLFDDVQVRFASASDISAEKDGSEDSFLDNSSASKPYSEPLSRPTKKQSSSFNLSTAVLCGGLAFDAYVEPAPNSSRWERGSQGLQVAFVSQAFARQLYQGLVEITVQRCTGLPETEAGTAERLVSGGSGADACLLVAVLEGQWKEDVQKLEKEQFHTGVLDLSGAAHVSRSTTCWSSVDEKKAEVSWNKYGRALPYHVKASGLFGSQGAEAVWPEHAASPFYLYVQDPATARLVFTVLDDDRLGPGTAVGSTHKRLVELIPQAALPPKQLIDSLKQKVVDELKQQQRQNKNGNGSSLGSLDTLNQLDDVTKIQLGATAWQGTLPLTSKPPKRDKSGQMWAAAAAGAALAGPVGAAAGAVAASFYEGPVRGSVQCRIRYLPIPPQVPVERRRYKVLGGMPGIDWGSLYEKYQKRVAALLPPMVGNGTDAAATPAADGEDAVGNKAMHVIEDIVEESDNKENSSSSKTEDAGSSDLEHCFFINHEKTGATCAVYRSLEKKLIMVSFRGTCAPIDLITDASLVQEAWVEGDDIENQSIPKVHVGFRKSLNSISRRLKELILATPAPGDDIADYDMLVTGHSLGGALSTLFTADIGQYGIDAGRALPQLLPSEPWWKGVANIFAGQGGNLDQSALKEPPRPKSLSLYNFGSPRVGNVAFAELFDALTGEGFIDQAYRIVNGDDVVARLPRTVNALVFGQINYDHVGTTVLISQPETTETTEDSSDTTAAEPKPLLWIEGVSDDTKCPVRDGVSLSSPTAEGTLLNDLLSATRTALDEKDSGSWTDKMFSAVGKVSERMKNLKASDVASVLGIDRDYTDRELRLIQSLVQGKALAHHLEDEYYAGVGRACGFLARVGEEVVELEEEEITV